VLEYGIIIQGGVCCVVILTEQIKMIFYGQCKSEEYKEGHQKFCIWQGLTNNHSGKFKS
jgi:hypothetical protein